MNAHTPFNANQDWTNPYCGNTSNDPMVDALLGNAYQVVRTVYCNLGNLKLIYDFLNQYGMVLGVQSEAELKALTTKATFARIYDKSPAGDRRVTDYLYVEGDRTGILPDVATATGSWVKVATSGSSAGEVENNIRPWIYNNGSAAGDETFIIVPEEAIGVPFITIDGLTNHVGIDFTFDVTNRKVELNNPLVAGSEVVCLLSGVPANPDTPNISNWTQINWLYNNGAAVGGEQVIEVPYTFQDIPAVFKNGLRLVKGLTTDSYTLDIANNRFILTEPLVVNDRLVAQIGGEVQVLSVPDHTLEEVARVANVKDSEVILSTDTVQTLNGKKVIYSVNEQKSYGLPVLPTNVYVQSVTSGKLTYNPGSVEVDLLPVPSDIRDSLEEYKTNVNSESGSGLIGTKLSLPGAIQRAVKDKLGDSVNVRDFGAVGDGVTDDTAAIQAAIDSGTRASEQLPSLSTTIHSVVFPEGKYAVSSLLVGRRTSLYFEGGSLQPFDATATQPYLIKFAEGYNKVYGIVIDMKYAMGYDTAIWCRGRYMDFIAPEIWAYKCAFTFGDPAWETDPTSGALGDSEIQIIGGWCNWGITHHRAYGLNTIVYIIGHEAYSYKWTLPAGDPRKAAWEAQAEVTGYNCGALIYLTGSFTGNFSGQQPNLMSQMQITNDPDYKNSYGRYVLSGTHCETGLLFQCDDHGANPIQDFQTQMLNAVNCTGYVSGGRNGYFINGLDAGQSISISHCNFYGVNMVNRAVYALNGRVHVSPDSFPNLTSGFVFDSIQARLFSGYDNFMPFRVGTSEQALTTSLSTLKLTTIMESDLDSAFVASAYNSSTGDFTVFQKMRNVKVDVQLSPIGGTSTDYTDIALYVNGVSVQILSANGAKPRASFLLRSVNSGDVIQIRVAHFQSRTLDGTLDNSISIVGSV